jgi:hypothetical protein
MMENQDESTSEGPIWDDQMRNNVRVFGLLFFYSCLMFTMPFGAFYGTRWAMTLYWEIEGFTNTCWSVASAVVVIHIIVFGFCYQAYKDDSKDVRSKDSLNKKDD